MFSREYMNTSVTSLTQADWSGSGEWRGSKAGSCSWWGGSPAPGLCTRTSTAALVWQPWSSRIRMTFKTSSTQWALTYRPSGTLRRTQENHNYVHYVISGKLERTQWHRLNDLFRWWLGSKWYSVEWPYRLLSVFSGFLRRRQNNMINYKSNGIA